jgi:hypothetical protein
LVNHIFLKDLAEINIRDISHYVILPLAGFENNISFLKSGYRRSRLCGTGGKYSKTFFHGWHADTTQINADEKLPVDCIVIDRQYSHPHAASRWVINVRAEGAED